MKNKLAPLESVGERFTEKTEMETDMYKISNTLEQKVAS